MFSALFYRAVTTNDELRARTTSLYNGQKAYPLAFPSTCFLDVVVTLERVLNFFTGAEEIPPEGFNNQPVLNFNPNEVLPTSSTCAVQLTLPTKYSEDYEAFKKMLDMGFVCHGGFGKH